MKAGRRAEFEVVGEPAQRLTVAPLDYKVRLRMCVQAVEAIV